MTSPTVTLLRTIALTLLVAAFATPELIAASSQENLTPREKEREELRDLFTIAANHRAGSENAEAWERLVSEAEKAVGDEMPTVLNEDQNGYSSEFVAWANERGMSPDEAAYYALIGRGMRVKALAYARDERAIPLFNRALHSPDDLVSAAAVVGLVFLEQVEAIPAIELESKRSSEIGKIFGTYLLVLDHPDAREAAVRMIDNEYVIASLEDSLDDHGPERILFQAEINLFELER
ncbi:MAG: hypothetical protein R3338_03655 [Thermoanaerobaculia bacterium]|nr:hypothetical protein [Thermoanaerobaculia bacterium]